MGGIKINTGVQEYAAQSLRNNYKCNRTSDYKVGNSIMFDLNFTSFIFYDRMIFVKKWLGVPI